VVNIIVTKCSDSQKYRAVLPTYFSKIQSLHYNMFWNRLELKYTRSGHLLQRSLIYSDLKLQLLIYVTNFMHRNIYTSDFSKSATCFGTP